MPVYKDKNDKWYVKVFYKNWKNEYKWTTKRGFKTKKEAVAWERVNTPGGMVHSDRARGA